jgi:hypothetical protein
VYKRIREEGRRGEERRFLGALHQENPEKT